MKADVEKLKKARDLIAQPGGWTQGAFAKNSAGCAVDPESSAAVCFCAYGAIRATEPYDVHTRLILKMMLVRAMDSRYDYSISNWNDAKVRTQPDVIAAFDKAISLAEAQQ